MAKLNLRSRRSISVMVAVAMVIVVCVMIGWWLSTRTANGHVGHISNTMTAPAQSSSTRIPGHSDHSAAADTDTDGVATQPPIDLAKATSKLNDCVNRSTPDKLEGDRSGAKAILRECFYSSGVHQGDIYALRSIGDDVKASVSFYDKDYGDAARAAGRVITEFKQGDTPVAYATCFWDVQLMQCKLQKLSFTYDGADLYNRSVRAEGQVLEPGY